VALAAAALRVSEGWAQEPGAAAPPAVRAPDFRKVYADTPVTRAVDRGLEFLRQAQLEDGSWLSPGYGKDTAIVSLAVMAFLARGHEPGRGPYGEAIERAVAWVLSHQREGLIVCDTSHGPMYSHGISTLMLGEVAGMIREDKAGLERLGRVHRSAADLVLRAQSVPKDRFHFGGWRYYPSSQDSDLSVTGWQLLALRAAKDAGLEVPKKHIDQALAYVKRCHHPSGGFSYQPGNISSQPGRDLPSLGMTGTGILALEICGEHGSSEARAAGDWLLKQGLEWRGDFFYYNAYYAAQAAYQLGGEYWARWQPLSEGLLLREQKPDGSWPFPPPLSHEAQAGPAYSTAMAVLSLGVEFRYLPIYQR
jgi:hypothetical protein